MATVLFFGVLVIVLFFHQSFKNLVRDELLPEQMVEFRQDNLDFWVICALCAAAAAINAHFSTGWTQWAVSFALCLLILLCSGSRFYSWFQILKSAYKP